MRGRLRRRLRRRLELPSDCQVYLERIYIRQFPSVARKCNQAVKRLQRGDVRLGNRRRGEKFPQSRFGIVDPISILPFWVGFALRTWSLHYVHSVCALRLLKFYRYILAMRSFVAGFVKARDRLAGMGMVVLIVMFFGAVGIYRIEEWRTAGNVWQVIQRDLVDHGHTNNCWLWRRLPRHCGRSSLCPSDHDRRSGDYSSLHRYYRQ